MRVLLLTPYSPLLVHDHAAQDLAKGMIAALKDRVELHVYSPSHGKDHPFASFEVDGVTYHGDDLVSPESGATHFGIYPRSLREAWPKASTRRVLELVDLLRPQVVHGEYLQTAEPLLKMGAKTARTMTLHDLSANVSFRSATGAHFVKRVYRKIQVWLTLRLELKILRAADHIFTLSPKDAEQIKALTNVASALRIGVDVPEEPWQPLQTADHRLLFAGALWREANQMTAQFLAQEVLPLVRLGCPEAELRIVGASPSATVRQLTDLDGVDVIGRVESFDDEFRSSSLVLSPSMVEAGILLKALRSMACGAPTVLNDASAKPIENLVAGRHALVANSADEMASAIVGALENPTDSQRMGEEARRFVLANYSWSRYADGMIDGFDRALNR